MAGGLDGLHLVGSCLADSLEGRFRLVAQVLGLLAGFRRLTLQVAEAIFSAKRRAAGEGASAAAVKPSQRHRSPSWVTSR